MQIGSTNEKVRNNTIQDLKDFNQQSLSTRAKKGLCVKLTITASERDACY